jgi:SpoVK/Ycf46/Vps4 family AAA+-type ATPase
MNALRIDVDATEVTRRDFDEAMERVGPSIAPEDDAWYQKFSKRLRRERASAPTPVA